MRLLTRPLSDTELPACLFFNRLNHRALISQFFGVVSRLGNGLFWYILMLVLPLLYGFAGLLVTAQMMLTGVISLVLYKSLKISTHRPRPYQLHDNILMTEPALDKFSFPSGHTMHAVGFTLVLLNTYPQLGLWLSPFVVLIALSRLVLGLHYPSDVLMGAFIGMLVGSGVVSIFAA